MFHSYFVAWCPIFQHSVLDDARVRLVSSLAAVVVVVTLMVGYAGELCCIQGLSFLTSLSDLSWPLAWVLVMMHILARC